MKEKIFGTQGSWISGVVGLFLLISTPMVDGAPSQASYKPEMPLGLDEEAFKVPQDNPMTKEKTHSTNF